MSSPQFDLARFWNAYYYVVNERGKIDWKLMADTMMKEDEALKKKGKKELSEALRQHYYYLLRECKTLSGLKNFGSSCFMNVVIQTMNTMPFLKESIINLNIDQLKQNFNNQPKPHQIAISMAEALHNLFLALKVDDDKIKNAALQTLLKMVPDLGCHLLENTHNGAQELMMSMFEHLQRLDVNFCSVLSMCDGIENISNECMVCHSVSNTKWPISSVGLAIHTDKETLPEMLLNHTKREFMTGNNKCKCENCGIKTVHQKQLSFDQLPRILIFAIHQYNANTIYDPSIDPTLDFSNYMLSKTISPNIDLVETGQDIKYYLNAVILYDRHSKATENKSGHYRDFVYDHSEDLWIYNDDEKCSPSQLNHVIEAHGAYIVMYIAETKRNQYNLYIQSKEESKNEEEEESKNEEEEESKNETKDNENQSKLDSENIGLTFDQIQKSMDSMNFEEKIDCLASKGMSMVTKLLNYAHCIKKENDDKFQRLIIYEGETKNTLKNKCKNLVNRYGM